jgi:hypothetical protein
MMQALLTETPISDAELNRIHKLLKQTKAHKSVKSAKGETK